MSPPHEAVYQFGEGGVTSYVCRIVQTLLSLLGRDGSKYFQVQKCRRYRVRHGRLRR
jgi:hypothetical protein